MSDASSVRMSTNLPAATGRAASSLRYHNRKLKVSNGVRWEQVAVDSQEYVKKAACVAAGATGTLFTADRAYKVLAISEVHGVAETTAATLTMQVVKDLPGDTAGGGTALLTTAFNGKATASVVRAGTLVATEATLTLSEGDSLALKLSAAATELKNVVISFILQPIADPRVKVVVDTKNITTNTTAPFYISDGAYLINAITNTNTANGGVLTGTIKKGATTLHAAGSLDLNTASSAVNLTATAATKTLAAGDILNFTLANNAVTNYTGSRVTVYMTPV